MFELTKLQINALADEVNFNRNTTEKVLRLYAILEYLNSGELTNLLVLKGGTAINLFVLDLPRLSVDIDLDFNLPLKKEDMMEKRVLIDRKIRDYMADNGYYLSDKSKFVHTLDSYVYSYTTLSGSKDILKIEINYSDRVHVLKSQVSESTDKLGRKIRTLRLADDELIGSKINALIVRTTPRDVFDVYTLLKNDKVKNEEIIRKIAIFYVCLGTERPIDFETMLNKACEKISNLNFKRIKETLIPVLHKGIVVDIKEMSEYVNEKLKEIFRLDDNDRRFIENFNLKIFSPDVLFSEINIEDISNHPMGKWRMM